MTVAYHGLLMVSEGNEVPKPLGRYQQRVETPHIKPLPADRPHGLQRLRERTFDRDGAQDHHVVEPREFRKRLVPIVIVRENRVPMPTPARDLEDRALDT